jgi:hypothetical protein
MWIIGTIGGYGIIYPELSFRDNGLVGFPPKVGDKIRRRLEALYA